MKKSKYVDNCKSIDTLNFSTSIFNFNQLNNITPSKNSFQLMPSSQLTPTPLSGNYGRNLSAYDYSLFL